MASALIEFNLVFDGGEADRHVLDFYDAAQAMIGFQRSLALTTHLVLNNEIITQAPSLSGARILSLPPDEGSWKKKAIVVLGAAGLYSVGTAPTDTPLGHLVHSAYDYVISETLGFHVDYDQSLGQQLEQARRENADVVDGLDQTRFDSLVEKCEFAIRDMHRPIAYSETAESASISSICGSTQKGVGKPLNLLTFEQIKATNERSDEVYYAKVASYNINTYRGRAYVPELNRPIPFELADTARSLRSIELITQSLQKSASDRSNSELLALEAIAFESRTGRIKKLLVTSVNRD